MQIVTATDLARHTGKILDAVASGRETVLVERNHVAVARIMPAEATMTAAQALANWRPMLHPGQGRVWLDAGRAGFDETVRDPWA